MENKETPLLPLAKIDASDRTRSDFGDLEELKESLTALGVIQPVLVSTKKDGTYKLHAGGRRHKAATELGWETIPAYIRDELRDNPEMAVLIELEENLKRKDFTWHERVNHIAKYHFMRKISSDSSRWTQRMTGDLIGVSQSDVSAALILYDEMRKEPQGIVAKATSAMEAIELLAKRREHELMEIYSKKLKASARAEEEATAALPFPDEEEGEPDLRELEEGEERQVSPVPRARPQPMQARLYHGDCIKGLVELAKYFPIHHIVTDPPYAINPDNIKTADVEDIRAEHEDLPFTLEMLKEFMQVAYDCIHTNGYMCMFYAPEHYQYLRETASAIGWIVQIWPFEWVKTSSCHNRVPNQWFTKSVEPCLIMRRSASSLLVRPQTNNYCLAPAPQGATHPFEKPLPVLERLISAISNPGQTICDPFMGHGATLIQAMGSQRMPLGCELNDYHFSMASKRVEEFYRKLTQTEEPTTNEDSAG